MNKPKNQIMMIIIMFSCVLLFGTKLFGTKDENLVLPKHMREKKLFRNRTDNSELESEIENYENKIQDFEKLLKNKKQKTKLKQKRTNNNKVNSIEQKIKQYRDLINKLKKEIEEIKNLLNETKSDKNTRKRNITEEPIEEEDEVVVEEEGEKDLKNNENEYPVSKVIAGTDDYPINKKNLGGKISNNKFDELEDRINENENIILDLQHKLRALKTQDDEDRDIEEIKENLALIGKIINDLKEKIIENEATNKENAEKMQNEKDKLTELENKIQDNENTILKLQKTLSKYKNKDKIFQDTSPKTTMIITADFPIYPDEYTNDYECKIKGNEFEFKKRNTYYIEISPTNDLDEAKRIYKMILNRQFNKHFINPVVKNNEQFFRNLVEVKNIHELGTIYKNLKSEFKKIKIIK